MKCGNLAPVVLALAIISVGTPWGIGIAGAQRGGVPVAPPAPAVAVPATSEFTVRSKVDSVTVYRGQALVTRAIDIPSGTGLAEFVVTELPERIVPGSIFAEGGDGVDVRSVRYRQRPSATDVREDVRKLDDAIQALADKLAANQKQQQVLGEQRAYLDKLANFAAPTATIELTKGVLNADQLKTLTNYQFESRKTIADQELRLQIEQRGFQEQNSLFARQRQEITSRSSRTLREAVIFINRERANGSLRVRYLVDAATWSPSYNVRANADKTSAALEYQASIAQMSGEDWGDVAMTLSTASPNLVAAAPSLTPLQISLIAAASGGRLGTGGGGSFGGAADLGSAVRDLSYDAVQKGINTRRQNAEILRNTNAWNGLDLKIEEQRAAQDNNDKELNKVAEQMQVLELLTKDNKADARRVDPAEGIVMTYQLKSRTSLPSRADRQLIQIDQYKMDSKFYKIAIPVLTSYVYDEAELTNTSAVVLLAGPVSSYVGGQFVGSGFVDTVAVGQAFKVGFGIDSSLRATRERVEKTEQTQGGNRIVNYTYRIAMENFGSKAADVRLMDRLPTAKETEVRVNFDEADNLKLSSDKQYQLAERKKGILRWDVQVPAQKAANEAFALTYKMHLEHDKNLVIATSGLLAPELNELLKQ